MKRILDWLAAVYSIIPNLRELAIDSSKIFNELKDKITTIFDLLKEFKSEVKSELSERQNQLTQLLSDFRKYYNKKLEEQEEVIWELKKELTNLREPLPNIVGARYAMEGELVFVEEIERVFNFNIKDKNNIYTDFVTYRHQNESHEVEYNKFISQID